MSTRDELAWVHAETRALGGDPLGGLWFEGPSGRALDYPEDVDGAGPVDILALSSRYPLWTATRTSRGWEVREYGSRGPAVLVRDLSAWLRGQVRAVPPAED